MTGKTGDRRTARTRAALGHALFVLLQREEWDAISIQMLCDEADVARSSFYAHFDGKLALLDSLLTERLEVTGPKEHVLLWLANHVSENKALFHRITNSGSGQAVLDRFTRALAGNLRREYAARNVSLPDHVVDFLLGGTVAVLRQWAKTWKVKALPAVCADIQRMADAIVSAKW